MAYPFLLVLQSAKVDGRNINQLTRDLLRTSSQVYSADMFQTHVAADMVSAAERRRYRRTILERGGSQDQMMTLVEFSKGEQRRGVSTGLGDESGLSQGLLMLL